MKNKVVLITGSSIGIGREMAYVFAKEGAKVIVTYYKDRMEAEKVVKRCRELGASDVLLLHLDVMDDKSIVDAVERTIEKFGKISVLVNNAGVSHWMSFADQSFEDIEVEVRTNLEGLIKMTRQSIEHIEDAIINVASILGFLVEEKETVYCATKWGVRGFTKALALEYPDKKIYVVNPAGTATQMNDFLGTPPEKVAEIVLKLVKGDYDLESGADVNVLDYI